MKQRRIIVASLCVVAAARDVPAEQWRRRRRHPVAAARRARQVLRHLPQPADEDRRARARRAGPGGVARPRRQCGKRSCASCGPARCRRPDGRGPTRRSSTASRRGSSRTSTAAALEHPNPGRPTLHRLNRVEYRNAIRDLLALEIDPASLLPADNAALRVRQQRRCAVVVAGAAGTIPGGGGENQPDGARTVARIPVAGDDLRADRSRPGEPLQRRSAVGIARRAGDSLLLSCRRRVPVRTAVEREWRGRRHHGAHRRTAATRCEPQSAPGSGRDGRRAEFAKARERRRRARKTSWRRCSSACR